MNLEVTFAASISRLRLAVSCPGVLLEEDSLRVGFFGIRSVKVGDNPPPFNMYCLSQRVASGGDVLTTFSFEVV